MDATDVMDSLRVDTLKSIAKRAGILKSITRKAELIEALNRFVKTDPAGFVDRLAPVERNFFAEAVHRDPYLLPAFINYLMNKDAVKMRKQRSEFAPLLQT